MAAEPQPLYFRTLDSQPWERGDREATAEWQQARMLHAITRAVAEKGYAKVTVADVVGLAGVSRRTFYEHFEDVEDCFVAAYETATARAARRGGAAVRAATSTDWHERFEVAIAAYVRGSRPTRTWRGPASWTCRARGRGRSRRGGSCTSGSSPRCGRCATAAATARRDPADPGPGRRGRDRRARPGADLRPGRRVPPGAHPHARADRLGPAGIAVRATPRVGHARASSRPSVLPPGPPFPRVE